MVVGTYIAHGRVNIGAGLSADGLVCDRGLSRSEIFTESTGVRFGGAIREKQRRAMSTCPPRPAGREGFCCPLTLSAVAQTAVPQNQALSPQFDGNSSRRLPIIRTSTTRTHNETPAPPRAVPCLLSVLACRPGTGGRLWPARRQSAAPSAASWGTSSAALLRLHPSQPLPPPRASSG